MLVHAFISSRLNYCNSLLYSVDDELLQKLQVIQNAAANVVTGDRKFDHITPVLCKLHWLPICQCLSFKLAKTVFKCLSGLAPSYLADDCMPVSSVDSRHHLRSADTWKLVIRRTTLFSVPEASPSPVQLFGTRCLPTSEFYIALPPGQFMKFVLSLKQNVITKITNKLWLTFTFTSAMMS